MTEAEVRGLCLKSREIFLQQPILLELEAPLKICGKYLFYLNVYYTRAFEERRVYYNRVNVSTYIRIVAPTLEYYGFVFRLTYKLFISNCEELPKEYYCLRKIFQNI